MRDWKKEAAKLNDHFGCQGEPTFSCPDCDYIVQALESAYRQGQRAAYEDAAKVSALRGRERNCMDCNTANRLMEIFEAQAQHIERQLSHDDR